METFVYYYFRDSEANAQEKKLGYPIKILFDLSPTLFTVSGVFYAIGIFRYRLFDILPTGRDMVVESMGDAMFTLDSANRIVDFNPAATRLLGATGELIGKTATAFFADVPGLDVRIWLQCVRYF